MKRYWSYVKNNSKFSSNLYVLKNTESGKTVFMKVSVVDVGRILDKSQ